MVELLFTTEAFCPEGRPVSGVPMLLDSSMGTIEPACAWLMHIALVRGRTRSRETWRSYGEALYDWWQTLEANGWTWDCVGYHQIAAYRDGMLTGQNGRTYARATINFRLRIVALFYHWCFSRGLTKAMPFTTQELAVGRWRPPSFLAHVDASGGMRSVNELVLREVAALPRPLPPEVIRRIVAPLSARDRLITEWAAMTGMRRMEIAGLGKSAVPRTGAVEFASMPLVPVRLDVTKGGRIRQVYPPLPLVDRTHAYMNEERAAVVRRAGSQKAGYHEPKNLFLTSHGTAMTPRRIGATFAAACHAADVTASFHSLRHTFAGVMLRLLQRQVIDRNSDINPLLTLQTILGHASLTTTSMYLRMVAIDLEAIEAAVDGLFKALA